MQENTDVLLKFAGDLAHEAGTIILDYFEASDKSVQIKQDESPVTAADKLINQLVIDRVTAAFPEHGILAEEGSEHEDRKQLWVCDPIDGTNSFIQRIPTALFSLAYVVDGVPEVAVIFDPFQDKLFTAVKGMGAFGNGKPIHVSDHAGLDKAAIGMTSRYQDIKKCQALFDSMLEKGVKHVFVPGCAFKGSLVATGHNDALIFPGRSAHDTAALKLIVEEAGGKVTDLRGKEQRYDRPTCGALITNGYLHDELVKLLADFGTENYIGY